jgi:acyl-coenzyme A synthetase/AMP-(fatty) acid ligase
MSARWVAQAEGDVPAQQTPRPTAANDVAFVMHISGTTVRPKVVPLTQGNLVACAR